MVPLGLVNHLLLEWNTCSATLHLNLSQLIMEIWCCWATDYLCNTVLGWFWSWPLDLLPWKNCLLHKWTKQNLPVALVMVLLVALKELVRFYKSLQICINGRNAVVIIEPSLRNEAYQPINLVLESTTPKEQIGCIEADVKVCPRVFSCGLLTSRWLHSSWYAVSRLWVEGFPCMKSCQAPLAPGRWTRDVCGQRCGWGINM